MDSDTLQLPKNEALAMALRVEDVMHTMAKILDGAEAATPPSDHQKRTLILIARGRNNELKHVIKRLRGET